MVVALMQRERDTHRDLAPLVRSFLPSSPRRACENRLLGQHLVPGRVRLPYLVRLRVWEGREPPFHESIREEVSFEREKRELYEYEYV